MMPDGPLRLGRRHLPLLAFPLVIPGRAGAVPVETRFRILREGSQIGTHRVAFAEAEGGLTARTDVDVVVRLVGITVFRLTHRFAETWSQGRLRLVTSRRDRNGTITEMTARAAEGAILVTGTEGPQRLPAGAAPLTWWDQARLVGPLFDNVTGKPLRLAFAREALPGGGTRWATTGEEESEARYATDGTWTGWRTKAEDGSIVTYERA